MTLLLAWAAFDDGKEDPAAIYIATDSRISWKTKDRWDYAQKVFCVPHSREIFGYCGDVMCVTQTLSQVVQLANAKTFDGIITTEGRLALYVDLIGQALASYPEGQIVSESNILYVRRHNDTYAIYEITITEKKEVSVEQWHLSRELYPNEKKEERTDRIVRGSGKSTFINKYPSTSYQAFHSLCECIDDTALKSVGGVPQVVTIRRNGDCLILGVNIKGKNFVLGLPVSSPSQFARVKDWRNEDFERWDPRTNKRMADAKRQPRGASGNSTWKLPY